MIHHSFQAMGTTVEAWTDNDDDGTRIRAWFEVVEQKCSRFRPDSELSRINKSGQTKLQVAGILSEVFEAGAQARTRTEGLVDVGSGAAVEGWGYDRPFDLRMGMDSEPDPIEAPMWSFEDGILNREPGVLFDFGGLAKGWACDLAVESGRAIVVSAGGDIRSNHPGTTVPIIDPWGKVATTIELGVGALATSSRTRRRWRVGSRQVSHLIDPRTMTPTESPALSASVLADTATEAEGAAKAVLLLGEAGLEWADATEWVRSALVIWHDGSVYGTHGVEVTV